MVNYFQELKEIHSVKLCVEQGEGRERHTLIAEAAKSRNLQFFKFRLNSRTNKIINKVDGEEERDKPRVFTNYFHFKLKDIGMGETIGGKILKGRLLTHCLKGL